MEMDFVARASVSIAAPIARVWEGLVDARLIRQYMFGATVICDWTEGSVISWTGQWEGSSYQEFGRIITADPEKRLQYYHFGPKLPPEGTLPADFKTVTIDLWEEYHGTRLSLVQHGNLTKAARGEAESGWRSILDGLKRVVERVHTQSGVRTKVPSSFTH